jgi:methyltransferase OMS1
MLGAVGLARTGLRNPGLKGLMAGRANMVRMMATRPSPKGGIGLNRLDRMKAHLEKLNQDPKFKKRAASVLIVFYLVTAYFGIRYLRDTKHKATGEPSPYKSLDDVEDVAGIPSARDTTEIYDSLAQDYDKKIRMEEFLSTIWLKRRKVMKNVSGDVLEVACGTGRNIPYFRPDNVSSITFLDPSMPMLRVAKEKFESKYPKYENVQFVKGRAEDLIDITSNSGQRFDTIYESFGLCSHEDPERALKNFTQLLRPGGTIVLLEHGRSDKESLNERMDKRAAARFKEWGCRWNLDIDQIVQNSGLEIVDQQRYHFGTTYFYVLKPKTN